MRVDESDLVLVESPVASKILRTREAAADCGSVVTAGYGRLRAVSRMRHHGHAPAAMSAPRLSHEWADAGTRMGRCQHTRGAISCW